MNRKDLAANVARQTDLTAAQAEAAVTAALSEVVAAVASGQKVSLAGFGTFEPRDRPARTGRNPRTGESMEIAASTVPAFKPASGFKQAVSER